MMTVGLPPVAFLAPTNEFVGAVNNLPVDFDYIKYMAFINTWGTHFISTGTLGGYAVQTGSVETSYSFNYKDFTCQANAHVALGNKKGGVSVGYSRTSTSSDFSSQTSVTSFLYGGSDDIPISDWSEWVVTIPSQPVLTDVTLVALSSLVSDTVKAMNLDKAVAIYLHSLATNETTPSESSLFVHDLTTSNNCNGGCNAGQFLVSAAGLDDGNYLTGCTTCYNFQFTSFTYGNYFGSSISSRAGARSTSTIVGSGTSTSSYQAPFAGQERPLPGVDRVGCGFDASTGELQVQQILAFGPFSETFVNPETGVSYSYPSQVTPIAGTSEGIQSYFHDSVSSVAKQQAFDAGISGQVGAFGASLSASHASRSFFGGQTALVIVRDSVESYAIDAASAVVTTTEFQVAVRNLSFVVDQTYEEFVSTWGTHYVSRVSMGGKMEMWSSTSQAYYGYSSSTSVQASARDLFIYFQSGFSSGGSSQSFNDASFAETMLFGGDFFKQSMGQSFNLSQWKSSTNYNPYPVGDQLIPIYALFNDSTKAAAMKAFVDSYISGVEPPDYTVPQVQINLNLQATPHDGWNCYSSLGANSVVHAIGYVEGDWCMDTANMVCGTWEFDPSPPNRVTESFSKSPPSVAYDCNPFFVYTFTPTGGWPACDDYATTPMGCAQLAYSWTGPTVLSPRAALWKGGRR